MGRSHSGYRLFEDEALWCVQVIHGLRASGLTVAEIGELSDPAERLGPRLAGLLDAAWERAASRVDELQQLLERIDAFEATHRAELAGEIHFDTGEPRGGA